MEGDQEYSADLKFKRSYLQVNLKLAGAVGRGYVALTKLKWV